VGRVPENPARHVSIGDLRTGVRLLRALPDFLKHPLSVDQAAATLAERLRERDEHFLALARTAIYGHPASPYRTLLERAGCEYGELRQLVERHGLEEALATLVRNGVYLTMDELKGRTPVVRGTTRLTVDPAGLRHPLAQTHALAHTSGSRGPGTPVPVDLRFVRDLGVNICLTTAARGGLAWRHATWTIPGSAAIAAALSYSAFGSHWVRWFSQIDPRTPALHPRYRWSSRVMRMGGLLAGLSLPTPCYVPLEDPRPIVEWLHATLDAGETPHLLTFPSSALRICATARSEGQSLEGVKFMLGGEPITAARLAVIKEVGATMTTGYGTAETGPCGVGDACLAPGVPDEVHVFHDFHALVQTDASWGHSTLPPGTLLVSSLRPTAPVILLNVSLGDQAVVAKRSCECPLQKLGWTTHLHTIRSREKLTSAGMTFLDTDVVRALEEVLPARFGGIPTDYQLVEEETEEGRPRLRLLVHPSVGPLDEKAVIDALLSSIAAGSGVERLMGLVWEQARLIQIERRLAYATTTGKILHVHVEGRPREAST
jgi:hypothetical protein